MDSLPLVPGASGPGVVDLQHRLSALGFEAEDDESGTFGAGTEAAVRRFQTDRGLRVDGVVGSQTWTGLVEAGHRLGDRWLYLTLPMQRGDDVAELQRRLSALGFHGERVDGIFGQATAAALHDFQRNAGLVVDGICGPAALQALRRLGDRHAAADSVAGVREREKLRRAPRTLVDRTIAVAESGGLDALSGALRRSLQRAGANVVLVHHPDGAEQAARANAAGADALLSLTMRIEGEGCTTAYFAGFASESVGGKLLAELIHQRLPETLGLEGCGTRGMALPVLRESRMPAVVCELAPAQVVVERGAAVADTFVAVLSDWACSSWD